MNLLFVNLSKTLQRRLVFVKGEGVGRGVDWGSRVSRWKLLCMEWISNKVLLHRTGTIFSVL